MYAPHAVTLYNVTEDPETLVQVTGITVLQNVFLDASKAANAKLTGPEGADAVALIIPFDVNATDGGTGQAKTYAEPVAYAAAADKSGLWTLEPGGRCFFIKGVVVEMGASFQELNANHDGVYKVTKVDTKDFGSAAMQHWEVGGA